MNKIVRFLEHELSGRMTRLLIWGVFTIGLMLTASVTWRIKATAEQHESLDFDTRCSAIQRLIASRLDEHASILLSGAAIFGTSETLTREEWRHFTQQLKVEKRFPGIQGVGFALLIPQDELSRHTQEIRKEGFPDYQVRPAGERDVYSSILYLEPFSGRNLRAFGYDMFSEPVRRLAMERARDMDAAALSGKVFLVQETDREVQAGTLMYVPVYRKGMPRETVEQRRAALVGWVYSPYRMTDLLQGILKDTTGQFKKLKKLEIFDGDHPSSEGLLFSTLPTQEKPDRDGRLQKYHAVEFNGHCWTLGFTQRERALWAPEYVGVWLAFLGGTVCTLLMCMLLLVMLNTSKASLLQSKERLSLAVRSGGVGIWDYDVVNNRLVWDDQMFKLYGITQEQFSGAYEAWQAGLHPEDRQAGDERIQLALRGEKDFDIEFRVLWPDGTTHFIRGVALVQRNDAGAPLHMIGTNWDITEMKLAAENIKRQASLINSLLDSMPDIVFFKNVEGCYLGCNPRFAEVVGRAKEEIVGKTDYDLFDKAIADVFRQNDRLMLELDESRHSEEWITYPDGRKILIDTLKTPYRGPDGELLGMLGISRDITARHLAEVALHESEANFRAFFETMTDMIMVATPDGRIICTNVAVPQTLGYVQEELQGMMLLDLHPAEVRQEAANTVAAMFRGERESCPLPLARKDGILVPVLTRIWLGKWDGKECLFGVCKDLTAEQEANQRFERLFHTSPCPIALSSLPDPRFLDVNSAFLKALGYSREEAIGNSSASLGLFVHPEQQTALEERIAADGRVTDMELQLRRKDGTIFDGLLSGEAFVSQGKRYWMTVMIDITSRKRGEAELARLSVLQHALMCLATEFVNVPFERQEEAINQSLATMGRLIHADRSYLFKYDFEKGVMSNTHEWCEAGVAPEIGNLQSVPLELFPFWVEAHRRGKRVHIPNVEALQREDPLWQVLAPQGIQSLITLPLIQEGDCLGFVGFDAVQQARNWKEEEGSLLQVLAELYAHFESRRSLERKTQELQQRLTEARDAAQEAARAKSLFLANMSHEIRTPLNAILGYAQLMGRECMVKACPMSKRLGAIMRSGEHLLDLLTDLLELVRSDSQELKLSIGSFDFYQALEDVHLIFARQPAAQSLTLGFSCAPNVPQYICSDSGKVRQILVNLLGNALKCTKKGSVRLSVSLLPGEVSAGITLAVDIEDTGCGIRPEEVKRLFELFYTHAEDGGHKTAKGTGLGLPLSRRYARALGGDVAVVRSTPGEGSCFRFTFQARLVDGAAVKHLHKGVVSRLAPQQPPCRILVVDDDPDNCEMLVDLLEPLGITIETASSAAEALHRLRQSLTFDLVLMDKRMPGMDGYAALRHLRELPGGEKIAVLIVTASGEVEERETALAAGAMGYISKPIRREKLLEEISRVTGIQYEYETPLTVSSGEEKRPVLDAQKLSLLPPDLLQKLSQALKRGDVQHLRELVDTVERAHAELGSGIRVLVDAYDYARLRNLIEETRGV